MSTTNRLADAISGDAGTPLFVPDLTLWFEWHQRAGTLPGRWADYGLREISLDLGVPVWHVHRPWARTWAFPVTEHQTESVRTVEYQTSRGVLTARWIVGPDGDWWQSEYPVKTEADLGPLDEISAGLSYQLASTKIEEQIENVGENGALAIELPMRPYSFLLHSFLGWTDGLMLAMMNEERITEHCGVIETAQHELEVRLATLPGRVLLSPDNLDASFLSPSVFEREMSDSYTRLAALARDHGKATTVHIGGMIRPLLGALSDTGVHCLEGICGPPQSDASLSEARSQTNDRTVLWGGIPQDALLDGYDRAQFEALVGETRKEAEAAGNCIVGIADRVPVEAEVERIEWIAEYFGS
jgi:hypothetical protein